MSKLDGDGAWFRTTPSMRMQVIVIVCISNMEGQSPTNAVDFSCKPSYTKDVTSALGQELSYSATHFGFLFQL